MEVDGLAAIAPVGVGHDSGEAPVETQVGVARVVAQVAVRHGQQRGIATQQFDGRAGLRALDIGDGRRAAVRQVPVAHIAIDEAFGSAGAAAGGALREGEDLGDGRIRQARTRPHAVPAQVATTGLERIVGRQGRAGPVGAAT